jgi:uncharacterized protein YecT (DUF1311 family)
MRLRLLAAVTALVAIETPATAGQPTAREYSADYARCMNSEAALQGIQPALNGCARDEYQRQDRRLNMTYQAAMATQPDRARTSLRQLQRRWIVKRDRVCLAKRSEYEGGSMAPLVYFTCMMDETIMRTTWLRRY